MAGSHQHMGSTFGTTPPVAAKPHRSARRRPGRPSGRALWRSAFLASGKRGKRKARMLALDRGAHKSHNQNPVSKCSTQSHVTKQEGGYPQLFLVRMVTFITRVLIVAHKGKHEFQPVVLRVPLPGMVLKGKPKEPQSKARQKPHATGWEGAETCQTKACDEHVSKFLGDAPACTKSNTPMFLQSLFPS